VKLVFWLKYSTEKVIQQIGGSGSSRRSTFLQTQKPGFSCGSGVSVTADSGPFNWVACRFRLPNKECVIQIWQYERDENIGNK
jgi:hypothetical protein